MTTPQTEAISRVEVPGLEQLKQAVDPALSGMPDWLHAMVWAALVMVLLYVVLYWLLRHGLPWASTILAAPLRTLVELSGIALLLPGYLVSTSIRRLGGGVPGLMFMYDDLVQNVTKACHWTTDAILTMPIRLRNISKFGLTIVLISLVGFWDVTYCNGAGKGCTLPTSQWVNTVSRAIESSDSSTKPTPCPTKKKSGSERLEKCPLKRK